MSPKAVAALNKMKMENVSVSGTWSADQLLQQDSLLLKIMENKTNFSWFQQILDQD